MSLSTTITFVDPRKFPPLLRLHDGVSRPDIRKAMGRAIRTTIQDHFRALDVERHRGGSHPHFYGRAVKAVQQPELLGGDGVKVSINQAGIAQRFFGGDIEAKPGRKLAFPVHPESYGHRAREFTDLHPIYFRDGSGVLVKDNTESPNGIGEVYFRLVKRVHQEPDSSVLPTEEAQTAAALAAGEGHMKTLIERAKGGS